MTRLAGLVILVSAGVAYGQTDDRRSYHTQGIGNQELILIPAVPGDSGFVITDFDSAVYAIFQLRQDGETIARFSRSTVRFKSGIKLDSGTTLTVFPEGFDAHSITISGYVFQPGVSRDVRSFYVDGLGGVEYVLIPNVTGSSGFVITDILQHREGNNWVLRQDGVQIIRFDTTTQEVHFSSGLRLNSGSVLSYFSENNVTDHIVVISGYYVEPPNFENVPAIGTIGLVLFACGLMAAGGHVLRRRRVVAV